MKGFTISSVSSIVNFGVGLPRVVIQSRSIYHHKRLILVLAGVASLNLPSRSKSTALPPGCQFGYLCNSKSELYMALPKLVVFDLDYTIWPFWVDTHVDPPFTMGSNGKVYDARQQHVKYYTDVPGILSNLHKEGFYLGIASRTSLPVAASDLTRLFNWDQFFHYRQIYPGCKITHFKKLHEQSGIAYEDMIFFDDEHRNIHDVSTLGVTCILVPDGVNKHSFERGMQVFKERRATKPKLSQS